MKRGRDLAKKFPGLFVVHHNKPGDQVKKHEHQEHHLIVPLRGEVHLEVEGKTMAFGPGSMAYIPSKCEHHFLSSNQKEGERLIALVEPSLWKNVGGSKESFALLPTHQLCKELLFELLLNPKSRAVKELVLCFASVLLDAVRAGQGGQDTLSFDALLAKANDVRVKKAVEFLEERFCDEIDVATTAKHAGLSARNLSRLFQQELGMGPKEVLVKMRLIEAQRLLRDKNMSVTEACYAVGYQSLSSFIQSFRDCFGVLPSEVSRL